MFGSDDSYYVGSAAKEDIAPNEIYVYVPNRVLITVERARHSEIGFIFEKHQSIFKANEDRDFLVLLVFLIYEHSKGASSFWHPYFQAVDPGDLACYWEDDIIEKVEDQELRE